MATKNATELTSKLLSNMIGALLADTTDSNEEVNFVYRLLLSNIQVSNLCSTFANNWSANIKLSKTQLSEFMQ